MNYQSKKSKKGGIRSMDEIHRLKGIKTKTETKNPFLQDIVDQRKLMERTKNQFKKKKPIKKVTVNSGIFRPIHTKKKTKVKNLDFDLAKKLADALIKLSDNEKEYIMDSFGLPSPQEIKMEFDWDEESDGIVGKEKKPKKQSHFRIKETKKPTSDNIPIRDKGTKEKKQEIGTEIASGDDGKDNQDKLPQDKKDLHLPGFSDQEIDDILEDLIEEKKKENKKEKKKNPLTFLSSAQFQTYTKF